MESAIRKSAEELKTAGNLLHSTQQVQSAAVIYRKAIEELDAEDAASNPNQPANARLLRIVLHGNLSASLPE